MPVWNPASELINETLFNRQGDAFSLTTEPFNFQHKQLMLQSVDEAWDFLHELEHEQYSSLEKRLEGHPALQSNYVSSPIHLIADALARGDFNIFITHRDQTENLKRIEALYNQIKLKLGQIIASEKAEALAIDQKYQLMSASEKKQANAGSFGKGLKDAGTSFLIWTKDVVEVISPLFRSIRQIKAYRDTPYEGSVFEWLKNVDQTYRESNYKELVEALGFDPRKIDTQQFQQAWEITQIVWDDKQCQSLLTRFAKDYYRAQHPTEVSEFAGGAAFDILLTIVLTLLTGGAAIAVMAASKARLIRQMKQLGEIFKELASLLKEVDRYIPKTSMRSRSTGNMIEDLPVDDRPAPRVSAPPRGGSQR
ncbi:hypothetical protein [Endozoicomonas arenosclerae]|uniref:hypothetical protein n=1 Tax=Endozoicomonas arenosclerae TaxID=1633495 RepID=UPI000784C566|nr:hypothetical protein [Endozoicomonas arenosclerae]